MDPISKKLSEHYEGTFREFGRSSLGADWGSDEKKLELRYMNMLHVASKEKNPRWSLLDVGCGYGGLLTHARERGLEVSYTGIDAAPSMVTAARETFPESRFICGDYLDSSAELVADYVVCNGILTQKLDTSNITMDEYAARLIKALFSSCKKGAAFNIMSTKVNYFSSNLYYRNPAELIGWIMSEITPHFRIDHSYPLFEFTVYMYRDAQ